ncbi:MAG: SLBB domain-containing protein [bacterium]|nr:SLBB domain-containing protein [bacterium]
MAFKTAILIVCWFLSGASLVFAQSGGYLERSQGQAGTSGDIYEREVLIEVQIWGQVNKPGRYRVPVTTDVVGLISYAGGPTEDAALSRVKLVRGAFGPGQTQKVNISKYTGKADKSLVPMLEQGDVVIVPSTLYHKLMRAASFLSQAAVVVTAYLVVAGVR